MGTEPRGQVPGSLAALAVSSSLCPGGTGPFLLAFPMLWSLPAESMVRNVLFPQAGHGRARGAAALPASFWRLEGGDKWNKMLPFLLVTSKVTKIQPSSNS